MKQREFERMAKWIKEDHCCRWEGCTIIVASKKKYCNGHRLQSNARRRAEYINRQKEKNPEYSRDNSRAFKRRIRERNRVLEEKRLIDRIKIECKAALEKTNRILQEKGISRDEVRIQVELALRKPVSNCYHQNFQEI